MLKETRNEEKYHERLEAVIDLVKNTGFTHIRADLPDYEHPGKFVSKSNDYVFTPDISAVKGERKGYFEIAKKTNDLKKLVGKWKLLAMLAQLKNGIFKIFVPYGHMKFTRDILKTHNIEADLVKM